MTPIADAVATIMANPAPVVFLDSCILLDIVVLPSIALDLPDRLRQLSADLLAAAVVLGHHASALGLAMDRVIASRLPARKGGQGAKDAVILEHVLETVRQLRAVGFTRSCIFASSNTRDFATTSSMSLNPVLVPEFAPISLHYAASLIHGETMLQSAGWVP